jgi:acyl-CoA thioester hydrolase
MEKVFLKSKVLWAQIDANMHLRHSAYADFAAQARVEMLETLGMTANVMQQQMIGPILFREESIYYKEIKLGDSVNVTCALSQCRTDGSRWSFVQKIYNQDEVLAARVNVDGAWIDMKIRKLTAPPAGFNEKFLSELPKTENFIVEPLPEK